MKTAHEHQPVREPGPEQVLDPAQVQRVVQKTVGRWATITGQWLAVQDLRLDVLVHHNGLTETLGLNEDPTLAGLRALVPEPERERMRRCQSAFLEAVEHCLPCRNGTDCTLALTHRYRRPDGRFGRLQRHVLPLIWGRDGQVRALLHLCREVSGLHGVPGSGAWSLSGPEALREHFLRTLNELPPGTWIPSARERELLQLLAQGLTSQAIAARLHRSVHTVNTHRRNLLRKAGMPNTTALVEEARKQGWV